MSTRRNAADHPWKSRVYNDPRAATQTTRSRLDVRISDETRAQLDDLLATTGLSITGIVTRAIAEMHQRRVSGTPMHAPQPMTKPAVRLYHYTCSACGHRGATPIDGPTLCVICDAVVRRSLIALED